MSRTHGTGILKYVVLLSLLFNGCKDGSKSTPSSSSAAQNNPEYSAALMRWVPSGIADHFPNEIPSEATDVKILENISSSQAASYLQLRMKLPDAEIKAIVGRDLSAAKHTFHGGGDGDSHDVPTTYDYESADRVTGFPESFSFYVLISKDESENQGSFNHGSSAGIAISESTNQIVYWSDSW